MANNWLIEESSALKLDFMCSEQKSVIASYTSTMDIGKSGDDSVNFTVISSRCHGSYAILMIVLKSTITRVIMFKKKRVERKE